MMKQASNPTLPSITSHIKNTRGPTEKELVYQLESTERDAPLLMPAKKRFLLKDLVHKDDLLTHAELFDCVFYSSLKTAILNTIPSKARSINKSNNRNLAETIATLFEPLLLLHDHIQAQVNEEVDKVKHLRESTSSKRKENKTDILAFLDEVKSLHSKLQQRVFNHRLKPTKDTLSKDIQLSDSLHERKRSKDRVPVPFVHQHCVMCGHCSTNLPVENDQIQKHTTSR